MSFLEDKRRVKLVHYNFMIGNIKKQMQEIKDTLNAMNSEEATFRNSENVDLVIEYDEIWKKLDYLKKSYDQCPKNLPEGCEISKSLYEKQYGDVDYFRQVFLKKHPEFVKLDEYRKAKKELMSKYDELNNNMKHCQSKVDVLLAKLKKNNEEKIF